MVTIKDVRDSNATFKAIATPGMVAVFVGATSGIGMGTLKAFVKYANAPKAYIFGRSESAAGRLVNDLRLSNPSAILCFPEGEKSSEGIDSPQSLRYYSRLRFAYDLLPLLQAAPKPRVISILAGGREKSIDLNDLEVKQNFSMMKAASNGTTQTTLAFEELAKSNPRISFIHKYPGFVDTGAVGRLMSSTTGIYAILATFFRLMVLPVLNLFAMSVEEAGERGLFLAISSRYPPTELREGGVSGVELPARVEVARSSVVNENAGSNGVYRLKADDHSAPDGDILPDYRKDAGKIVWESTVSV